MKYLALFACLLGACLVSGALGPVRAQDCSDLYDPGQVLDLHVTMEPADWEALRFSCLGGQCGPKPYTYFPATLRCEDGSEIDVGIRRKNGNAVPSNANPLKPALKIDINEFVPEQTFAGKSKLSLENGADGSLITEGLAWQLYERAGVVGLRAAWVNLYVNGDHKGLYVNIEQVDKRFLADRGIDDGGWLFKDEEQRTRENELNPYGFKWYPFDHPRDRPLELPPLNWQEEASWRVDMEQLLTLGVLENYTANIDGFFGGRHNYWYYDWSVFPEGQQPRLYLAWDLDNTMHDENATLPMLAGPPGSLRLGLTIGDPGFQSQYLETYADLLSGPLVLYWVFAVIASTEQVVAPHMNADPHQTIGSAAAEFDRLRDFFQQRTLYLLSALGACSDGTCGLGETPCTCPADCGLAPVAEFDCTDGHDADCDGFVDCGDGDCAADAACSAAPLPNDVRITEVLANSQGSPDVEYVEIHNAGPAAQDLTGWYLLDDDNSHTKAQLQGTLGPGEYLVVAGDIDLFTATWDVPNLSGQQFDSAVTGQGFSLGNGGDQIRLFRPSPQGDELAHGFTFGVQGADVPFGYYPRDAEAPEHLQTPTPGVANDVTTPYSDVCINEFLTTSQSGGVDDWVELYNRGGSTIDISGWHLSDKASEPTKYTFPAGSVVPAGGYLSVEESELGFGFSSTGSEVVMLSAPGGETGFDYFDYGPQFPDVSRGRFADGTSGWQFFSPSSRDMPNSCNELPLAPVTGFRFPSPTVFVWDELLGAKAYDVVTGDLSLLRETSGGYLAAEFACHKNNTLTPMWWDAATPSSAAGLFYLVRGVDLACSFGTYDSGFTSQVAPRTAAAAACP